MRTNRRLKRKIRHIRVRKRVSGTSQCPRLAVFRSNRSIYVQLIDDLTGKTLVSASSLDLKAIQPKKKKLSVKKVDVANEVGKLAGEKAKKAKIEKAVFDRSGYKYHGRVAAVAEGARSKGLKL